MSVSVLGPRLREEAREVLVAGVHLLGAVEVVAVAVARVHALGLRAAHVRDRERVVGEVGAVGLARELREAVGADDEAPVGLLLVLAAKLDLVSRRSARSRCPRSGPAARGASGRPCCRSRPEAGTCSAGWPAAGRRAGRRAAQTCAASRGRCRRRSASSSAAGDIVAALVRAAVVDDLADVVREALRVLEQLVVRVLTLELVERRGSRCACRSVP